jgi:hypothetical protein
MRTDNWSWPAELDALTAAPGNHQVLLKNDCVRVLLTTIPTGATTPAHTHRWPSVEYVITATDFVHRDPGGNVLLDTLAAGTKPNKSDVLWSDPFPHTRSRTSATQSSA